MIRSNINWWDNDPDIARSPWRTTSGDGVRTGFRIIAPLETMTAQGKQIAWEPDSEDLLSDVKNRIQKGRGSYVGIEHLEKAVGRNR